MSNRVCSVDDCERPHYGRGFCSMHYKRWTLYGRLERIVKLRESDFCSVDGCNKPFSARGMCKSHAAKAYNETPEGGNKNRERVRKWRKENPEKKKNQIRKRKALKRGAPRDGWTDIDVWNRDKGICQICFEEVPKDLPKDDYTNPLYPHIDHIKALAYGGTDLFQNVRLTHNKCNTNRSVEDERNGK